MISGALFHVLLQTALWRKDCYYSHFVDEKTKARELKDFMLVTGLVSDPSLVPKPSLLITVISYYKHFECQTTVVGRIIKMRGVVWFTKQWLHSFSYLTSREQGQVRVISVLPASRTGSGTEAYSELEE